MKHKNNPSAATDELRRRAEEFARKQRGEPAGPLGSSSPDAMRQMLHELEVHQIELEMQNEELRRTQLELEAARARYFDLYDLAPIGYVTLSEQGVILEANLVAANLLGVARSALIQQPISRFIHKPDQDLYYLHCKQLYETEAPQTFELRMIGSGGALFWAYLSSTIVQDAQGASRCRVVLSDITERKRAEEVQVFLAQTSRGLADASFFKALACYLAQSLQMDFVCIDRLEGYGLMARTVAVWCDGKFEDNVSYALKDTPCGEVVGQTVCCFPASVSQFFPRDQVLQELRAESYVGVTVWSHTGQPIGLIAVIGRRPLVNRAQAEATLKLVAVRTAGELERLDAEAMIQTSLHEKESLLKEIHHRVKNNMQIISSLLRLQSAKIEDPSAKAALQDMQNRIRSMSLIREQFYRSENLTRIDLAAYLKNLCHQLFRALVARPDTIQLQLDLAPVHLDINQAIPCGLLVNELISNALKHAFPEGASGELRVELQPVNGGPLMRLRVADNGVGLPLDFDPDHITTLGLHLVSDLVRQIRGRLRMQRGPGLSFDVEFTPQTVTQTGAMADD